MSSTESHKETLSGSKPNILLVVMDDMGYSDLGCYGSEIDTPNINKLAEDGLRFSQIYNTGRCWPTRSSILTGYYAPQVCMDPPNPVYRPSWQRLIPQFLKSSNYRSYHSGKWHVANTKDPEKEGGFDTSFGYDIEQYNHFFDFDGETKFSSTGITDHALKCLEDHEANHSDKPFFHYLAYTAPHFPVQAEQEDIDKYKDKYNEGWDIMRQRRHKRQLEIGLVNCNLSKREDDVPAPHYLAQKEAWDANYGPGEIEYAVAWDSLTEEQKTFQATKMAIHAAMIDRTDRELGRILDHLKKTNTYEDTLILFLSDNGASAELMIRGGGHDPDARPGSVDSHLCLGPGWSTCCNTPFRRHKIWVHEGGVSTALVAHWPKGITAKGELRHDMGHVIDFLPTFLDLAGVSENDIERANAPRLPGKSLVPSFIKNNSVKRDHIFFHHEGNRALRAGDWKLVNESNVNRGQNDNPWALYDLSKDRCEMVDLSKDNPQKFQEMQSHWQVFEDEYRTARETN